MLEEKTYLATLLSQDSTHEGKGFEEQLEFYSLKNFPFTSQCDTAGNVLENHINIKEERSWEEVNDSFYASGRDKIWENYIKSFQIQKDTIPVLPVESLDILPDFHSKRTYMTKGRAFSEKECSEKQKVCIVSEKFAERH